MIKYNDIMVVEGYQELMELRSKLEAVPLEFILYKGEFVEDCIWKSLNEFQLDCNQILSPEINAYISFYVDLLWSGTKKKKEFFHGVDGYIGKENKLTILKFFEDTHDTFQRRRSKQTSYPYDIGIEMTKEMFEFINRKRSLLTRWNEMVTDHEKYIDILQANSEQFKKEVFDLLFRQLMLTQPTK